MALFQSSVIKKELQSLNQSLIDEKWNEFFSHFGNPEIQQKIRGLKEEQYQGEFLDDLFVKVLGYTKPPKPNHNLVTEQKNETNSKKADGAIIIDEKVKGVIELKGTNTTDLEKVNDQAFLYKVNHPECIYVITSNFEKLRFYIENKVDYIEFNLFQLTKKEFSLLYLCLSYDSIRKNTPKHLKDESVSKENQITKQLYKDYSDFKRALYNNLVELNPQYDKLLLFKKTQKLLDRFLFIFFAEDRQLVPTNLIRRINLEWEDIVKVKRINVSLYDRYKTYFDDLNAGATVTLPAFGKKTGDAITAQFEIFAYNGGLFAPDDVLDNVRIDDNLLHKHSLLLSDYDFESDVDVNILGHIFENSLNEIDEIKSEIEGQLIDKTKTKRKKDGVYYTPKYITKYIVDNTVGKLCFEKKTELNIVDEDYTNDKKVQTKTKKAHLDKLTEYRNWLLQLTICDPACGSGAFLNQALEFLIAEHRYIDELQAKLMGDSLVLSDVEKSILENNIYGVDLNDESVEIAKLSLWLRTAQKGRKLNSLNNNIKCGNSLIDDPEVAGEKAFKWQQEFPTVFEKGGFDVVIGNPPYVDMRNMNSNEIVYFKKEYSTASDRVNLFGLFVEKAFIIMSQKSEYGMIIHRNLIRSNEYEKCRNLILNETNLNSILSFKNGVFEGVTGEMTALTFTKTKSINLSNNVKIFNYNIKIDDSVKYTTISQNTFNKCLGKRFNVYLTNEKELILNKIVMHTIPLGNISYTLQGIIAGDEKKFISKSKENDSYKAILRGRDISRYRSNSPSEYIYYVEGTKVLTRSRKRENFECVEKILTQHVAGGINAYLDTASTYYMQTINGTIIKDEQYNSRYILAILNSKLISFYYDNTFNIGAELTTAVAIENIDLIPILAISIKDQKSFVDKAELMLSMNKKLQELSQKFLNLLQSDLNLEKTSNKIEKWFNLSWSEFEMELIKLTITLSGLLKDDWFDRFERFKKQALELKTQIDQTDKEIDKMVYELYGLTEEEIQIVENN
jgi:type I restriction-modification system DNA methylase subunit